MDSMKARLGGKSLRALGKKVLRRTPAANSSLSGAASAREETASFSDNEQIQRVGSRSHGDSTIGNGGGSRDMPAFLMRPPDTNWIDIEMMSYWLQKCDAEHGAECRKPFGLDPAHLGRPKWLIDVQRKCLVTTEPSHRYACLSYVWGGAATLKAGRANIDGLMEEQSLELHRDEIPKTIRHTIGLCAQLGVPYLWVDALCIVQDDLDSKHEDIQAMAGIYANAYVTFVAGNGWDANHGLRGIQGVTESRQLSSSWKYGSVEDIEPYDSIWYSRGWTFQEMVFSPRKIMFQYQLAIWECNSASWHESSLSRIPTPLAESNFTPSINPWRSKIHFSEWPDVKQYILIVDAYTTRKLTYAEDTLNAITSLLSVMSSSFQGGFISGLPKMFFDEALLWQPAEPMQRRQASVASNYFPSWSWAGWEGQILSHAWLTHWMHLRDHELPNPVARAVSVLVIPAVAWFFGNTLQDKNPIDISGHKYVGHRTDKRLPLPSKWSFTSDVPRGAAKYVYDDNLNTLSAYPVPVGSLDYSRELQSPPVITARYLLAGPKGGILSVNRTRVLFAMQILLGP